MIILWVEVGWIGELSIVVLFVEVLLSSLACSDESLNMELVREVLVQVVLEVLDMSQVLLD